MLSEPFPTFPRVGQLVGLSQNPKINLTKKFQKQEQKDIQFFKYLKKLQEDIEKEQQFFSAVSHELKTPITVIKGQLEGMLFDIGAYKDHKKYLARSLAVTNTLETMVQEILTVSRLETNAFKHSQFDISQTGNHAKKRPTFCQTLFSHC